MYKERKISPTKQVEFLEISENSHENLNGLKNPPAGVL